MCECHTKGQKYLDWVAAGHSMVGVSILSIGASVQDGWALPENCTDKKRGYESKKVENFINFDAFQLVLT